MFRHPLFRTFAVLVVSLALTTPLCEAASPVRSRTSSVFTRFGLWEWVTNLWTKNGCSLDPGGLCVPNLNPSGHLVVPVPSGSSTDAGCGIDPGGRTCGGHS
jgi:hypothetical protein